MIDIVSYQQDAAFGSLHMQTLSGKTMFCFKFCRLAGKQRRGSKQLP